MTYREVISANRMATNCADLFLSVNDAADGKREDPVEITERTKKNNNTESAGGDVTLTRRRTSQSPGRERRGKSHEQKKTAALGVRLFSFSSVRTARTEKTEAFLNEKQRGSAGLERRGQRTFSSRRATEGSRKGRRRDGHTRYEKERKRETEHETEEWVFEKNNTQRERERERDAIGASTPSTRSCGSLSAPRFIAFHCIVRRVLPVASKIRPNRSSLAVQHGKNSEKFENGIADSPVSPRFASIVGSGPINEAIFGIFDPTTTWSPQRSHPSVLAFSLVTLNM